MRLCCALLVLVVAALVAPYAMPPGPCLPLVDGEGTGEALRTAPLCRFSRLWPHIDAINAAGARLPESLTALDPASFRRRNAEMGAAHPVAATRAFPLATADGGAAVAEDFAAVAADINRLGNTMAKVVLQDEAETSLRRRTQLMRFFERHPDAADDVSAIRRPIVLCGLPRTGSSMLQRLLARDPAARSLPLWILEADPLSPASVAPDKTAAMAGIEALQFVSRDAFGRLMQWHNMSADNSEEDIMWMYAAAASIWDMAWMLTGRESTTFERAMSMSAGDRSKAAVYEYLARTLQAWSSPHNAHRLLGSDDTPGHFVLKANVHTLYLPLLLERFPDARIVMTHRNVRRVVRSYVPLQLVPVTALIKGVGQGGTREAAAVRNTALALAEYIRILARRAVEFARAEEEAADTTDEDGEAGSSSSTGTRRVNKALHVRHADLMADPIGTVERIYAHFGMTVSDAFRRHLEEDLRSVPPRSSGAGKFVQSLAEMGLDDEADEEVRELLNSDDVRRYHARFLGEGGE